MLGFNEESVTRGFNSQQLLSALQKEEDTLVLKLNTVLNDFKKYFNRKHIIQVNCC